MQKLFKQIQISALSVNLHGLSEWDVLICDYSIATLRRSTPLRNPGSVNKLRYNTKAPKKWEIRLNNPSDQDLEAGQSIDDSLLAFCARFLASISLNPGTSATEMKRLVRSWIYNAMRAWACKEIQAVELKGEVSENLPCGGVLKSVKTNYFAEYYGYVYYVPEDVLLKYENWADGWSQWQKTEMNTWQTPGQWTGLIDGFCVDGQGNLRPAQTPDDAPKKPVYLISPCRQRDQYSKMRRHAIIAKASASAMRGLSGIGEVMNKIMEEERANARAC